MSAHCKKVFLPFLVILLVTIPWLPAASLKWLHLGTIDAGLAGLAIDGKIAYRKMPPGRATPWGNISAGHHRFQVALGENLGSTFELEIAEDQKITIVTVADKNGDLQCRTFGLDKPQGEVFVLNMMPNTAMSLPEDKQKVIFGKGFWLPDGKGKQTLSLVDGNGFHVEVDFVRLGNKPPGSYLAVICRNDDGQPNLAILGNRDSLFEMSEEPIEIAGELKAGIRVISKGRDVAAGSFDPTGVNWEEVESRMFWLNLSIVADPCRLEIRGFPAMRRMPSGRGSGFVKWPAGDWNADIVVERTNEKLSNNSFSLSPKASLGLVSTGGGKYPHRLLVLEGRSREESPSDATAQIRFVNALPDGILKAVAPYLPEPVTITLNAGEIGKALPLAKGGFPGATFDLSRGAMKNQVIARVPPLPTIPPGDWVVVIHLDQESFAAPVLTWVEMDKGTITFPAAQ